MKPVLKTHGRGFLKIKAILAAVFCTVTVVSVSAQGTLYFTAFLDSPVTDSTGEGVFTLTDQLFIYNLTAPLGTDFAEIHGPGPNEDAPLIAVLQPRGCIAPAPPFPGACYFRGSFELSGEQVSQLLDYQLYVWTYFVTAPSHSLSGQIVPEPKPCQLFLLSAFFFSLFAALRHFRNGRYKLKITEK